MKNYLDLLTTLMTQECNRKEDRTGVGTRSTFGQQLRFDLRKGFPLVTTKKCHLRSIIHELLWFLSGDTNIKYLKENGVRIWDEWADVDGNLGPVYGKQWVKQESVKIIKRSEYETDEAYQGAIAAVESLGYLLEGEIPDICHTTPTVVYRKYINQIDNAMHLLKTDPDNRRIVVSAWNPADLPFMALEPCHMFFQFYTRTLRPYERLKLLYAQLPDPERHREMVTKERDVDKYYEEYNKLMAEYNIPVRELSCSFYMRSSDTFLGLPFNIASYAMLTHMFAQQLNMTVGDLVYTGGDVHLYNNHHMQAMKQLAREPRDLPTLRFARKPESIYDYKFEDFIIENYNPHDAIPAPVAI